MRAIRRAARNLLSPVAIREIIASRVGGPFVHAKMAFREYAKAAWGIVDPSSRLIWSWAFDCLAEHLEAVTLGQIRQLIVNIQPRSGKSNICTILWPTWFWTELPSLRLMFCSYSSSLAVKHSTDRRNVLRSDFYKTRWGNYVRLSEDQNQKQAYENTARGHMLATSVGGTITGKGGDGIMMDDMLNPEHAESDAARKQTINTYRTLSTRLNEPKKGFKILVEQRTHRLDLTGHILKEEGASDLTHLVLPGMAEKKKIFIFPISKTKKVLEVGELLIPERWGPEEIKKLMKSLGSRRFVAEILQNPTSEKGNIFKREWWKYWQQIPKGIQGMLQSWDMAFKNTQDSSYVVGQVWAWIGANKYLLDQVRGHWSYSKTREKFRELSKKWPSAIAKLVEDKANGTAIIDDLKDEIVGIIPVEPLGSKVARAQAVAWMVEAGNVYIPDPALDGYDWIDEYIEEHAKFTGKTGEINDQVDGTSQALIRLKQLDTKVIEEQQEAGSFVDEEELQYAGGFST